MIYSQEMEQELFLQPQRLHEARCQKKVYKSTELEATIDSKKHTRHPGLNSNTHKSDKHSVLPCGLCKYLVSDQQQDQITGLRPILI